MMENYTGFEVAIIGMAGKFPGASNIGEFWTNLNGGVESISFFTDEELEGEGEILSNIDNPSYVKAHGMVENKDCFDNTFFNYNADEAKLMDPQMRMFHECVWTALEDAGCNLNDANNRIGMYVGSSANLNWEVYSQLANRDGMVDSFSASQLGNIRFLSSRISYALNFQGASVFIDTACSTSLVAIHQACRGLLFSDCNIALAGGISLSNKSKKGYLYEEGMIHSKDGHCRAFDASASGTVNGEGAGVVVLKTLKNAIKDGDHIYAIIKGSGINNDGNGKVGYAAPSVNGQAAAIMTAQKLAKVPAESIGMLEAHGTGTSLGDPIEVEALNLAFGKSEVHYCALGSVKTNIGHLDVAAGVAGLIKAVLAIKHRQIPASLHYEQANPEINFKESPFYVNTVLKDWRNDKYPLRAGVSSFGIGGTNAHLILEEAPAVKGSGESRSEQVLVFSAKSAAALDRNLEAFSTYLESGKVAELADVAYTLARGRSDFSFRKSLVCSNLEELQAALLSAKSANAAVVEAASAPEVIFMFSGQGSQYVQMYADLYTQEPYFKEIADQCFNLVELQSGVDLKPVLFGSAAELINQTRYAQPLLFIVEYGLARLLMSWGIRPDKMIGHSIGEYVAACLSGVFSLEDSLLLVSKRGELMQGAPVGDMLSIGIAEEELKDYLSSAPQVCLAAHNSSSQCVVSGSSEQIAEFKKTIELAGYSSRILHTSHAFHSHLMDGILDEFKGVLDKVKINKPELPFISNVTGEFVQADEIGQAAYWVSHLREPVRFSEGAGRLLSGTGAAVLIEVGPGKTLSTFIRSHHLRNSSHQVVSLVRGAQEEGNDLKQLLTGFGKLWSHGVKIDWNGFYSGQVRKKVSLPTYSFEPVRYPVNVNALELLSALHPAVLKESRKAVREWFYYPSWKLLSMPALSVKAKGSVLLFIDDDGVFEGLSSRYLESGRKVIRVRTGLAYAQESPLSYRVAPVEVSGYQALFASLSDYGLFAEQLVHGWGLDGEQEKFYTDASGDRYFYSLLEAVKCWADQGNVSREVVVLTSDLHPVLEQGEISGVQSMSLGLLKVLAQEYSGLSGRHIDISSSEISGGLVLDNLYKELQSGDRGSVVSLRQGHRWGEIFDSLSSDGALDSPAFKAGGTYLITGGSGQLGSVLNGYLQKNYQANVILLGRSASLREDHPGHLSAQVFYISCDISDEIAVEAAVKMAEERFGKVDGVIHAAGVVSGSSINVANELTASDFQAQFNPKVRGVEVLDAVFSSRELDFCILISSLSTVLGGLGFGAYGPANIYMDYYLKSQRKLGRLRQWMSVDLDGLSFSGIADDYISGEELTSVLEHSLHFLTHPRLVVSVKALDERYKRWVSSAPDSLLQVIAEEQVGQDRILSQESMLDLWQHILGKPGMDIDDDFFEMGGDSLKVLTLVGRIHKQFNVEISVKEFFNWTTVKKLDEYLSTKLELRKSGTGYVSIPKAAEADYYPLSYAQRRLYFLNQFDKDALAYNMSQIVRIKGKVDYEKFNRTFRLLVLRHESLRTYFEIVDGQSVQRVAEEADPEIVYFQGGDPDQLIADFIRPFELSRAPLIRLGLMALDTEEHILMVDMHHIISDGVSRNILIRDFMALYNEEVLPELNLQYKDYAVWQQSDRQQEEHQLHKDFWLKEYENEVLTLELPADFPRPLVKQYAGDHLSFELNELETSGLKKLAEKEGVTLFMLLFAVHSILLSKLGNQEDIIIGVPAAGREHAELENILGMFVNTLPIRTNPQGNLTFKEFLAEVKQKTLSCFEHQSYPFEELLDQLELQRDVSRNPLFESVFSFINIESTTLLIKDLALEAYEKTSAVAKFDLTLSASESAGKIKLDFEYSTSLFAKETIERFISYFRNILKIVFTDTTIGIGQVDMLSREETEVLINDFNRTKLTYEKEKTITKIFEEKVLFKGDSIAFRIGDEKITYDKLNQRSNQLARLILQKGVAKESIVGVLLSRSKDLIISLIAVLKAGCAYVPIDPEYPIDRIKYMIADSGLRLLLTEDKLKNIQHQLALDIDCIEVSLTESLNIGTDNLEMNFPSSNLAYLIYTSGSTGNPKGVMIEHRNVVNFIFGVSQKIKFSEHGTILSLTTYSFDIFVLETFIPLLRGMEIVMATSAQQKDPDLLAALIERQQVNMMQITPSHLKLLLSSVRFQQVLRVIKIIMIGGEALSGELFNDLKNYYKGEIYNMYGPTETTVWSTIKNLTHADLITIGSPIANTEIRILDKYGMMLPINIPGELCIGGDGVGRGYFGNEKLTNERFTEDPIDKRKRIYRTGDSAKWLANGDIEFAGRIDDQVKVRGFRIEPGEIVSCLLKHDDISEAIVKVMEKKGNNYLVAYYVSKKEIQKEDLRNFLLLKLPEYMMPAYYVPIAAIPLTDNGKINKKALPQPEILIEREHQGARNETESILVEIWSQVLEIEEERVSVNKSFFELGGNSLNAITIIYRIEKSFGVRIAVYEFFHKNLIIEISEIIASLRENKSTQILSSPIRRVEEAEFYKLSSPQKRVYYHHELNSDSLAYNMPQVLELHGQVDHIRLKDAFNKLIIRNEILRTSFKVSAGEIVQRISKQVDFDIEYFSAQDVSKCISEFFRPFELESAPLIRLGLMQTAINVSILMIDMHHIITDATSQQILIKEFMQLYHNTDLPVLSLQYKDFAEWQQNEGFQNVLVEQKRFWADEYSDLPATLNLPLDFSRPSIRDYSGRSISFKILTEQTGDLKKLANKEQVTMFMVLLAIYHILLSKLSSQEDIVTGVPVSGRQHPDIEKMMGMFVNTLPIRSKPNSNLSFIEFLSEIKLTSLSSFENQSYPYEVLIDELKISRTSGHNPLFDVMFSYNNILETELSIPGLEIKSYPNELTATKFDLTLIASEGKGEIQLHLDYSTELFKEETILRFAAYFRNIITAVLSDPSKRIADIQILSEVEQHELLFVFNDTTVPYPQNSHLISLFETQVAKTPNQTAVVTNDKKLSYRELHILSNRIGNYLRRIAGIKTGDLIGVMLEREEYLIPGIFGVLKSGGVYVPIDPEYPISRVAYMVSDSQLKLIITRTKHLKEGISVPIINLDECLAEIEVESFVSSKLNLNGRDLAYVIYTSGSTGNPKGVMVEHHSLINRLLWMQKKYPISQEDVLIQKTPLVFDVSVWELFWWSLTGATLCLLKQGDEKDPAELIKVIEEYKVTVIHFVPPMLAVFLSGIGKESDDEKAKSLRLVFASGEALKPDQVTQFGHNLNKQNKTRLINLYGPTEATVDVSYYECSFEGENKIIPIGKPIDNIQLYVLNHSKQLVPKGVIGELYIGGAGLARGYINNEKLTREKFISNPHKENDIIYSTGDMVRWLSNGDIEYLGRIDDQVKIRGVRIELQEIEFHLQQFPGINKVAVIPKERDEEKVLVVFYISNSDLDIQAIRSYLSDRLPYYMVPQHYSKVTDFPLTGNGKLNRNLLVIPEFGTNHGYEPPENEDEWKMVGLWSDILKIDINKIGVDNDFFEEGGHSFTAVLLVYQIQELFSVKITMREVFENPTVRKLVKLVSRRAAHVSVDIQNVGLKNYYPVSSEQKRLFGEQFIDAASVAYNISDLFEIKGELDIKKIEKTIEILINRHESLRTSFEMVEDGVIQLIHPELKFNLEVQIEEEVKDPEEILTQFIRPFSLSSFPLIRFLLLTIKDKGNYLLLDIHHIICDGVSLNILMNDFRSIYNGAELSLTTLRYVDYVYWQRNLQENLSGQKKFWLEKLSGELPQLNLPVSGERELIDATLAAIQVLKLDAELYAATKKHIANSNASPFMFFLAIYYLLLQKITGNNDIIIGTDMMGRRDVELMKIVGTFVNLLPLRMSINEEDSFDEFLEQVKECVMEAVDNQDFQLGSIIEGLRSQKQLSDKLINVHFSFPNLTQASTNPGSIGFIPIRSGKQLTTQFELKIEVVEQNNEFLIRFIYSDELYDNDTISMLMKYYLNILKHVLENKKILIEEMVLA
ncbi:amino acid adenylation domain-containing protein [Pedobacter sp. WC2423]|uniref:hybrid non-ribosomal peptide synthetase/type I polyketide synthase n=1 Tax=Pedobacter sp. WC2423 TaxID=3234142 RepID=UPI003465A817